MLKTLWVLVGLQILIVGLSFIKIKLTFLSLISIQVYFNVNYALGPKMYEDDDIDHMMKNSNMFMFILMNHLLIVKINKRYTNLLNLFTVIIMVLSVLEKTIGLKNIEK